MPDNKPNMIDSLRGKFDPHYKLSGKVEGLDKGISNQVSQIHKTLSKSFAMQRKTLVRVLGLEKRVTDNETRISNLADVAIKIGEEQAAEPAVPADIQQAAEEVVQAAEPADIQQAAEEVVQAAEEVEQAAEQVEEAAEEVGVEDEIPEGLDDVLSEIRGEEEFDAAHATPEEVEEYNSSVPMTDEEKEFVAEESKFDAVDKSVATKTKPKKKKPEAKKTKLKKPKTKKPPFKVKKRKIKAKDLKKGTPLDEGFASRVMGTDEKGDYLSKEERIAKFKGNKINADNLKPPESDGQKGGALEAILSGVNSIIETLKAEKKQDKTHFSFLRKSMETSKRKKKENKLELKVFEGLKNTATKVLEPVKSAWSKFIEFVGNVLLGNVLFKILNWMGNKENQGKLNSIIKFFEDWWPVLLGGYLIFGNALTGFALGLLKNMVVWGAKLVSTVIPALLKAATAMGPWGIAAAAVLGGGIYLATRKKKEPDQDMGDDGTTTERTSQSFTTRGGPEAEQLKNQMAESRGEETQNFKGGGLVEHGNKSTQQASNIIQAFNEGGPVMGYGMGEIAPDQFVFNKQEFKSHYITKGDKVIKDKETFTDIGGSIGVPDLIEHQTQLVESLRKVKGYEDINFMDVMQYPDGQGRLVGIPEETLYPILNSSDAAKATSKKIDAGHQRFLQNNDLIRPDGSVKGYSYFGGKLKVEGEGERDAVLAEGAIRKFNKGGSVPGSGNKDTVPAMLTPGEFVMSKGAVNKYGVDALENMNSAAGSVKKSKKDDTVPSMLTPGEFVVSAPAVQKYGVDTMESMNAMGGGTNKPELKESNESVLVNKGGLINNYENIKRNNYSTGGVVQYFQGGGSPVMPEESTGFFKGIGNIVSGKTFSGEDRVKPQRGRGQGNKIKAVSSTSKQPNIEPSDKKKNVISAYEQEKNKTSDKPNIEKSNSEIPQFNVLSGRSSPKIKVLGISV